MEKFTKMSSGIWGRKWSNVGNGEGLGQMVMWEHLMQCALFCLRHLFRKPKIWRNGMELENTMGMGLDIYLGWRRSDCKNSVAQLSWDNFWLICSCCWCDMIRWGRYFFLCIMFFACYQDSGFHAAWIFFLLSLLQSYIFFTKEWQIYQHVYYQYDVKTRWLLHYDMILLTLCSIGTLVRDST